MNSKIGSCFGRLTVIERLANKRHPSGKTSQQFLARCLCGNTTQVLWSRLASGKTTSCGCYRVDASREKQKTHGMCDTPEYAIWSTMKARTSNPKTPTFSHYGGRGITVCRRWMDSFEHFLCDIGRRPTSKHTLERINVDGNYEPGNVEWATMKVQQRNRRNNHLITVDGITRCLAEWSEISGVGFSTIIRRLKIGWSTTDAVFKKVR
jgi:hypothetical protein